MPLYAPEPLGDAHDLTLFSSGVASLDAWLKCRAGSNQLSGASRTYVATEGLHAVGYYSLAFGGLAIGHRPGDFPPDVMTPVRAFP